VIERSTHGCAMGATPIAVDLERETIVSVIAAPRHGTASPPDRDEDQRQSGSQAPRDDYGKADTRVRDSHRHDGGHHSQPADALHPNVGHIDERGGRCRQMSRHDDGPGPLPPNHPTGEDEHREDQTTE
jgi:hypothetical protein